MGLLRDGLPAHIRITDSRRTLPRRDAMTSPHTRRAALGRLGVLKDLFADHYAHDASPVGCEVASRE